ncbi:lectin BRA-3-like [Ostrea edulis]|uniref:lectin BRA-3-like n=1 Tax=Ostrea edulis TaxID=37623 RepID=UPI0024AFEE39|nr:lectin BRA-3-like [Ostrea edulis]
MNIQLLIFLAALTTVFAACPSHWSGHRNKCYFFSRDNETFSDALILCEMLGVQYRRPASIATIDSANTQKYLANLIRHSGSTAYYIGVNDIVNEGEFVWISSGQNATYLNWGPDQPNNRWGNENCVVIRYDPGQGFDMTWSDDPCTDLNTYICEMPAAEIHIPVVG